MSNTIVKYNDKGYIVAKMVPANTKEDDYEKGIDVGPPDALRTIMRDYLTTQQIKNLFELLFDLKMFKAPDLMNRRGEIASALQKVKVESRHLSNAVRAIISAYQEDYYG